METATQKLQHLWLTWRGVQLKGLVSWEQGKSDAIHNRKWKHKNIYLTLSYITKYTKLPRCVEGTAPKTFSWNLIRFYNATNKALLSQMAIHLTNLFLIYSKPSFHQVVVQVAPKTFHQILQHVAQWLWGGTKLGCHHFANLHGSSLRRNEIFAHFAF